MGATADRLRLGKGPSDVWLIGEDIDIYPDDGRALRSMADPPYLDDPDHYSDRLYEGDHCKCEQPEMHQSAQSVSMLDLTSISRHT